MKLYVENCGRYVVNGLSSRLRTAFVNDVGETIFFDVSAISNKKLSNEEYFIAINNVYGITHRDLDMQMIKDQLRYFNVIYCLENYLTLLEMLHIKNPEPIFVNSNKYKPIIQKGNKKNEFNYKYLLGNIQTK
jgi:hypothetical protein